MSNKDFASRKAYQSEVHPGSSGDTALNKDQVPNPFDWTYNANKTGVNLAMKTGYSFSDISAIFFTAPREITSDITIPDGANYMSIGPVEIADGVTVTVESGGSWVIV